MKENMPDISFERSMNHNYMILSKCCFFGKSDHNSRDYRTKMLLENQIPGLLPVTHRLINGESRYYYEINSLQSLDRLYGKAEIQYDALQQLLSGCVNLFDRLEEYLLDGTQIIMKPELIYIDVEKMEPYFVCYPDYEGDVRLSFMEFIDGLLTKIDHSDERAVMLGYRIYRYTRNPNYVISEIRNMTERTVINMAHVKTESAAKDPDPTPQMHMGSPMQPQNNFVVDSDEENEPESPENALAAKSKNIGDLIGGIFCIFVSLCSGTIILGARIIHTFQLSRNNELYLCGAMGMAIVAAALFFSCYIKKRHQEKAPEIREDDETYEYSQFYTAIRPEPDTHDEHSQRESKPANPVQHTHPANQYFSNETVYLGNSVIEERVLCGRINGKEVNIPLNRLPMTVGKLADVSDFVIHDTAVSKMHARFEEHDGRVYICDLNSTNGTVRNGVLLGVNQSVALEPGDQLRFGRTCFTYC